jgi:hypothetical protein
MAALMYGAKAVDYLIRLIRHRSVFAEALRLTLIHIHHPIPPRAAMVVGAEVVAAYHEEETHQVLAPVQAKLAAAVPCPPIQQQRGCCA